MAFNRLSCCVLLLYILASADAEGTISHLTGVWKSYFQSPNVHVLTPEGPALVCRDTLSPDCEAEITPTEGSYTFNGTTIAYEVRDRIGIKTVEQAADAYPECAKDGFYPIERIDTFPLSQIASYDPEDEILYFVDPRRSHEYNCLSAKYKTGENGVHLDVTQSLFYQGTVTDLSAHGYSFRCDQGPKRCAIVSACSGELALSILHSFSLTCIDGDCLNSGTALPPADLDVVYESLDDLL